MDKTDVAYALKGFLRSKKLWAGMVAMVFIVAIILAFIGGGMYTCDKSNGRFIGGFECVEFEVLDVCYVENYNTFLEIVCTDGEFIDPEYESSVNVSYEDIVG